MKETELKLYPCYCGGEMEIKKVAQNGGMDGTYYNWELTCKKCGLALTSAADGFYGRKYKTFEEVVGDWNRNRKRYFTKADVFDMIRAEIKEKIKQEEFARSVFRHDEKDTTKAEQCTGSIMAYNNVIKLIDKYKIESEE